MRVAVSGGHGRLGRLLVPALEAAGAQVYAPRRRELDWCDPEAVAQATRGVDRLVALASWTDVPGAQREPGACVRDTVSTAVATLRAAARNGSRVLYVSSDHVLAVLQPASGAGVYAASKLVSEQLVLNARHHVARVAFVTEEQVVSWSWVDGVGRACRCWADELVPQLVAWALQAQPEPLVHLGGPAPVTLAELLAQRHPTHPALQHVVRSAGELAELAKMPRPPDTSWPA